VAQKGTWQRAILRWGLHLISAAATRITRFGERYQVEWLIYNPLLFLYFFGRSLSDAPGVIRVLESAFPEARRYLDVGAGSGGFAAQVKRAGHSIVACEYNWMGRWFTERLGVESHAFDLSHADPAPGVKGRFDIAYSFEVAEHLPRELGVRLVEFMGMHADIVVFTAAVPGQGGMGHINEQSPDYWIQRFRDTGLELDDAVTARVRSGFQREAVADWFGSNAIVLRRSSPEITPGAI
jgi:SAM-dependent methyltransferase